MANKTLTCEWITRIPTGNWWDKGRTVGARQWRSSVAREQRQAAWVSLIAALRRLQWKQPVGASVITITVYRPRLMDDDGVERACKHIRDGIANALNGDPPKKYAYDGPNDPYQFEYEQHKGQDRIVIRIDKRE